MLFWGIYCSVLCLPVVIAWHPHTHPLMFLFTVPFSLFLYPRYRYKWVIYCSPTEQWRLWDALDERGEREVALRAAIKARFEIEEPPVEYCTTGSAYVGRKVRRVFGKKVRQVSLSLLACLLLQHVCVYVCVCHVCCMYVDLVGVVLLSSHSAVG
jgi:hypothetical protein